ncbi:hypothetical protein BJX63DRAFT_385095 [Aspergillus granulosus]|uniref:Resolvase HTH domain-containing protein n=1 Tax=Aspergillus granulosus TaxID=176169 RepID=A0ABR4HQS0_9EURO
MSSPAPNTSGKRKPAEELSPEARSAICRARSAGEGVTKLAQQFNVSRTTIYQTIKRAQELPNFDSRPRSGRKRKLNSTTIRRLHRLTKRFPQLSWPALVAHLPEPVSISTAQRALKQYQEKSKGKTNK